MDITFVYARRGFVLSFEMLEVSGYDFQRWAGIRRVFRDRDIFFVITSLFLERSIWVSLGVGSFLGGV